MRRRGDLRPGGGPTTRQPYTGPFALRTIRPARPVRAHATRQPTAERPVRTSAGTTCRTPPCDRSTKKRPSASGTIRAASPAQSVHSSDGSGGSGGSDSSGGSGQRRPHNRQHPVHATSGANHRADRSRTSPRRDARDRNPRSGSGSERTAAESRGGDSRAQAGVPADLVRRSRSSGADAPARTAETIYGKTKRPKPQL